MTKRKLTERERRVIVATGFEHATDDEVKAEFKRRNPPPPNPNAPTVREFDNWGLIN